jgi:prophage DNA circulation protein
MTRKTRFISVEWRSFSIGLLTAGLLVLGWTQAQAFDMKKLGNVGKTISTSVKSLTSIKSNLDKDVKYLTADAKTLMGDKDKLLAIKNQLFSLAAQTKKQIDSITALVKVVEGHIVKTQKDIVTTSKHVGEIDKVRKALSKAK